MIISDLSHLELVTEATAIRGGVGVSVSAEGVAYGDFSSTQTNAETITTPLPFNGSLGFGFGSVVAVAYDPYDAAVKVGVSGAATGDKTKIQENTYAVDAGNIAVGVGIVAVVAITPPSLG